MILNRFQKNGNDNNCILNAEIKKTYNNLSGIDIDEQYDIWDERAKGYWGEYKVFSKLFSNDIRLSRPIENIYT